jgi:hypothetical protein
MRLGVAHAQRAPSDVTYNDEALLTAHLMVRAEELTDTVRAPPVSYLYFMYCFAAAFVRI